jgi:DNA polymerase-3 subunit delta'
VAARLVADNLPHALLLEGPAGMGKHDFGRRLVRAALCREAAADGDACGRCSACVQFDAATHPDVTSVGLEDDRKVIVVSQIRALIEWIGLTSQYGGRKAVTIEPADRMNVSAANSLLKTLEEPPGQALLVLISAQPSLLPATIRSRCQKIRFAPPDRKVALHWLNAVERRDWEPLLALAGGAPLRAAALGEAGFDEERPKLAAELGGILRGNTDPVAVAARWLKNDPALNLRWLAGWTMDLILLGQGGENADLHNPDQRAQLATAARRLDLACLHRYLESLWKGIGLLDTQLNPQLLLESLLIPWGSRLEPATLDAIGRPA